MIQGFRSLRSLHALPKFLRPSGAYSSFNRSTPISLPNLKKGLIFLLSEEEIVSSWGISNITIDENSINFNVDGFLYKGRISIKYVETYFEISFGCDKKVRCVDATELTEILDSNIEKTDNYQHDLENWLSSFR